VSATAERIPYEQLGRPIRGPSALISDPKRVWHLTFNIARNNWKLRFFGSALGYLWQLVRPLLLFSVLYVFFTKIAKIGQGSDPGYRHYGVQLLGSIILFTFFSEATSGAVRSVVDNEALVRKIHFPRMVIPLSTVLLATFNLSLNMIVVLIFALGSGVHPMLSWLEVPVIIVVLAVLATGLAMLLSSLYVYFRDIAPIWDVLLQVLFYVSPVIVPFATVQAKLGAGSTLLHLYMLNPLTALLEQFRHAGVNHATPGATSVLGNVGLLEPVAVVVAVFIAGFVVFNRTAPYIAENT
jgi:ABC-2 type transport system permease protein